MYLVKISQPSRRSIIAFRSLIVEKQVIQSAAQADFKYKRHLTHVAAKLSLLGQVCASSGET
jgi:hypothetical protein